MVLFTLKMTLTFLKQLQPHILYLKKQLKTIFMRYLQFHLLALLLLLPVTTNAGKRYDPYTLYDYIKVNCLKKCVDSEELWREINLASDQMRLDPKLLLAVVRVESAFVISARNKSNVGLSQVNLRYHKPKFKGNYFDVGENIRVGASILNDCLKKHKQNVRKSLTCYNGGGTQGYDKKVLVAYKEISRLIF